MFRFLYTKNLKITNWTLKWVLSCFSCTGLVIWFEVMCELLLWKVSEVSSTYSHRLDYHNCYFLLYRMKIWMMLMVVQLTVFWKTNIRTYIKVFQLKGLHMWMHMLEIIWWHLHARYIQFPPVTILRLHITWLFLNFPHDRFRGHGAKNPHGLGLHSAWRTVLGKSQDIGEKWVKEVQSQNYICRLKIVYHSYSLWMMF